MLMAGFAPYMTYKTISFMGFDMYHAMSAEQEAKSALNRPIPIPLGGRGGASQPTKVLGGGPDGGTSNAGGPSGGASGGGPGASGSGGGSAGASAGGGGASGGGAAASGGATAGGAVAAGAVVAKKSAEAGPKLGNFVAAQANGHAEANQPAAPAATPPHVADSELSGSRS